ncbi:uncharacterized protein METZ01_LOCUS420803, partial [marine metagenome]
MKFSPSLFIYTYSQLTKTDVLSPRVTSANLLGYVTLDATPAISFNSGGTTTTRGAFSLNRDEIRTVRVILKSTVHRRG